jgi:hypothetical protein
MRDVFTFQGYRGGFLLSAEESKESSGAGLFLPCSAYRLGSKSGSLNCFCAAASGNEPITGAIANQAPSGRQAGNPRIFMLHESNPALLPKKVRNHSPEILPDASRLNL